MRFVEDFNDYELIEDNKEIVKIETITAKELDDTQFPLPF